MSVSSQPMHQQPVSWRHWSILALVLLSDMLDLLDSTLTTIAAPTIALDLGGGAALVEWLGAGYTLALGVLLVTGGRLGDKYGQRRLFLIGMAGFTVASTACGLSGGPLSIVFARMVQGAFGALLIPQGLALLTLTFPRQMLGRVFGMFGPVLGFSAVIGPVLAGLIIDANWWGLNWRPMFLMNLVLGVVGLIAAARLLPKDRGNPKVVVEILGSVLFAASMFGVMFGLIEGSSGGWGWVSVGSILAGLVLFGLFCLRQTTAPHPLITLSLLKNRGFTSGLIMILVFFAAINGLSYVLSLFMQDGLKASPTGAALGLAPMAGGIALVSLLCGGLVPRLGRRLILWGMAVTVAATFWLWGLVWLRGTDLTLWDVGWPILAMGAGMGGCFGALFDVVLGDIVPAEVGSASGLLGAVQQLANSIGAAAMMTFYYQSLPSGGIGSATAVNLLAGAVMLLICCALVFLLPRHARQQSDDAPAH